MDLVQNKYNIELMLDLLIEVHLDINSLKAQRNTEKGFVIWN